MQQTIHNLHRSGATKNRQHTITKMDDNINMDSTIAGSMNARR